MKNKIIIILHIISAICFYICAIIDFINDDSMAVFYLCIGSVFLCLIALHVKKDKNE